MKTLSFDEMQAVNGGAIDDADCWVGMGLALAGMIGSAWTGVGAILGALAVGNVVYAAIQCEKK